MGPIEKIIHEKISKALSPIALKVTNDSHKHQGHAGKPEGNETHFKVEIISAAFEGCSSLERHRMVYKILEKEMDNPIHALTLKLRVE